MWQQVTAPSYYHNSLYYTNDDSSSLLRGLLFRKSYLPEGKYETIILRFNSNEAANDFNLRYPEINAGFLFTKNFDDHTNSNGFESVYHYFKHKDVEDMVINLKQLKQLSLSRLIKFLQDDCHVTEDILTKLDLDYRKLGEIEENFYLLLPELNADNFQELFSLAISIDDKNLEQQMMSTGINYRDEALWDLANSCNNKNLLEEWLMVLKEIKGDNYIRSIASKELAYNTLSQLITAIENKSSDDEIIELLHQGLKYTSCMYDDREVECVSKRYVMSFIGINWKEELTLFPNYEKDSNDEDNLWVIIDLLIYIKSLRNKDLEKENKIKDLQQQVEELQKQVELLQQQNTNSAEEKPTKKPKLTL